jgi:hypothetical protein
VIIKTVLEIKIEIYYVNCTCNCLQLVGRPPLVGEVSANLCGYRVPRGQRRIPADVFSVF